MPTLLESLYYGHLAPEGQVVPRDPEYRRMCGEMSEAMEAWKEKLSGEEFTKLEALIDLQQEIQGLELTATFTYGFKLGAALMIEVHSGYGAEGQLLINGRMKDEANI